MDWKMIFLKYGYSTVLVFFLLTGCTSGVELVMNTIAGAVGSMVTNKYEKNVTDKSTVQNKKDQSKRQEVPKRKVPRFDY